MANVSKQMETFEANEEENGKHVAHEDVWNLSNL